MLALLALPALAIAAGAGADAARAALDQLDRSALWAIGIDTDAIADLAPIGHRLVRRPRGRLMFTRGARRAVVSAATQAAELGESTITSPLLLIGLLDAEPPDAALQVMRQLGVDVAGLRASLAPSRAG